MWRAGASEGRGGSSVKVSTKRGRSYLFVSYSRGGSHSFSGFFFMRMDKLPKNTGRILPRRDWKSEYYRLLDLESTQVRHLSKCYLLVGFLAHHVLFMWPRNLDLSISRDALGRTYNNHKVLHRLSQTPRIRYMNTFPD